METATSTGADTQVKAVGAKPDAAAGALAAAKDEPSTQCVDKKKCPEKVTIVITVQRKYNYHDIGTPGTFDARLKGDAKAAVTGHTTEQPPGSRNLGHGVKEYPIPAGDYKGIIKTDSSKNGNVKGHRGHAVKLLNVPNFSEILIHTGNYPSHSEGCIIAAASNAEGDANIENSASKVKELMDWIEGVRAKYGQENVDIEVIVKDPPAGAKPPPKPEPKPKKKGK